ncbi:hypothetical protein IWQ61_004398 [Dispira simplex]|nr:hypothetical protein IWQ61_004398 [Dispira simplex]
MANQSAPYISPTTTRLTKRPRLGQLKAVNRTVPLSVIERKWTHILDTTVAHVKHLLDSSISSALSQSQKHTVVKGMQTGLQHVQDRIHERLANLKCPRVYDGPTLNYSQLGEQRKVLEADLLSDIEYLYSLEVERTNLDRVVEKTFADLERLKEDNTSTPQHVGSVDENTKTPSPDAVPMATWEALDRTLTSVQQGGYNPSEDAQLCKIEAELHHQLERYHRHVEAVENFYRGLDTLQQRLTRILTKLDMQDTFLTHYHLGNLRHGD